MNNNIPSQDHQRKLIGQVQTLKPNLNKSNMNTNNTISNNLDIQQMNKTGSMNRVVSMVQEGMIRILGSERVMKSITLVSLSSFILVTFKWSSVFSVLLFMFSAYKLLEMKYRGMKEKGIIWYLPMSCQSHLLNRSLFDLLCDLWYIPQTTLYINAFLKPFISNVSPEDAHEVLEDLPLSAKQFILTKGLLNTLPESLQNALLPASSLVQSSKQTDQSQREEEETDSLTSTNTAHSYEEHSQTSKDSHSQSSLLAQQFPSQITYTSSSNQTSPSQSSHFQQNLSHSQQMTELQNTETCLNTQSYFDNSKYTFRSTQLYKHPLHEFSFNNNLFELAANEPNTFIKPFDNHNNNWKHMSSHSYSSEDSTTSSQHSFYDIFHNRSTLSEENEFPKTKVIASSSEKTINLTNEEVDKKVSVCPKLTDKWDKLELFRTKLKANCMKLIHSNQQQNRMNSGGIHRGNLLSSARQILNMFNNLMELKKMGNLQNMDNKKLMKICIISSVFMTAQVIASRRSRRWMVNTSLMLLYIISFFLTTGTLGIILYNYNNNNEKKESRMNKQQALQQHCSKQEAILQQNGKTEEVIQNAVSLL